MKMYFVVTIDVEPDCTQTWNYSNPLTFDGVKTGIRDILHPLFMKYGIVPTYLINNVVLEDQQSVEVLKTLDGEFELGTHLHPEFIEPEKTIYNYAGAKGAANCCFYAPETEFQKLENITNLFTEKFGYAPVSFRAGRFSAGKNTIRSLNRLGYKVDTSVTPHVTWNDATREQPVSYKNAAEQPYYTDTSSFPQPSASEHSLLQVPVSIVHKRKTSLRYFLTQLKRMKLKISYDKNVWLRPKYSNYNEFIEVVDDFKKKYGGEETIVLNMMFHNVEVMPSLSPYNKTQKDCDKYLASLERFFAYCVNNNINSIKLSGVYDLYRKR